MNTPGSFECNCVPGYEWDRNRTICVNIDECDKHLHICSVNGHCIDSICSYDCQCQAGYSDNSTWPDVGITCVDVDECFFDKQYCENRPDWCQPQNCFLGAHCDNTEGSFLCTCPEGMNGNGTHCEDIDECDEWLHNCDPVNGLHIPLFIK